MSRKVKVRVLENNTVANDRVHKKGDLVEVAPDDAARLVNEGRVQHAGVKVRALVSSLIGNTYRGAGEEFECSQAEALGGHKYSKLLILDPSALTGAGGLPVQIPLAKKSTPPPDPFAGLPRIKAKILQHVHFCGRTYSPGDTAVVPEYLGLIAQKAGKVQLSLASELVATGRHVATALDSGSPAGIKVVDGSRAFATIPAVE